ncbi:hypothetical protein M0R45_019756 [Rubus argutus]|uniref:Uncharacterized protein n=1 Tax=Rubus argutus TaxID=59490 RepID=A0AAW1X6A9_RUBAR
MGFAGSGGGFGVGRIMIWVRWIWDSCREFVDCGSVMMEEQQRIAEQGSCEAGLNWVLIDGLELSTAMVSLVQRRGLPRLGIALMAQ